METIDTSSIVFMMRAFKIVDAQLHKCGTNVYENLNWLD